MTSEIRIGEATVSQITELDHWPFPPRDLYPDAEDAQVADAAAVYGPRFVDPETGDLVLSIHTYVVRAGDTTIVVDTGNGNAKERPNLLPHHMFDTDYLDRFARAGGDVRDVDVVVNTHLHPDHCGWNTRLEGDRWLPTFPEATYVFFDEELAGLRELAESGTAEGVAADLARTFDDSVRPVLDSGRWEAVGDGHVLAEHGDTTVLLRAAPGHTGGHSVVEIRSPRGGAVLAGDVVHHPVQLLHPDLVQGGDADPGQARRTRDALLGRCADEGLLLLTAHFVGDHPFAVTRTGTGLRVDPRPGGRP